MGFQGHFKILTKYARHRQFVSSSCDSAGTDAPALPISRSCLVGSRPDLLTCPRFFPVTQLPAGAKLMGSGSQKGIIEPTSPYVLWEQPLSPALFELGSIACNTFRWSFSWPQASSSPSCTDKYSPENSSEQASFQISRVLSVLLSPVRLCCKL